MNLRRVRRKLKRRWRKGKASRNAFLIALAVGYLHLYLLCPIRGLPFSGMAGSTIEPLVSDLWFELRGAINAPSDVVLIYVDEMSYEKLGVSTVAPWPRSLIAQLLEKLSEYAPKKIILDFRFAEQRDAASDENLANALKLSSAYISAFRRESNRVSLDGQHEETREWLNSNKMFEANAGGVFFADLLMSRGVVRSFFYDDNDVVPMAKVIYGNDTRGQPLPKPTDLINFYGPPGSIRSVPFYRVLDAADPLPREAFQDKYVFVGQALFMDYRAHQTDSFPTPFQRWTPGVEIHATCAANILSGNWIREFTRQQLGMYAIISGALLTYLLLRLRPSRGGIFLAATMGCWSTVSYCLFLRHFFLPGASLTLGVLPLVYVFGCIRTYYRARRLELALGLRPNH